MSKAHNKVAINAVVLLTQKVLTALLSLITTPLLLKKLGVEGYGIFTLTLGFVGTIAFINWSLVSATQRYIAFSIGSEDNSKVKTIFASSLVIHLFYSLLVLLIIVIFNDYFVTKFLSIPAARIDATKTIIVIVAFISFFNIIMTPFSALLNAHENFFFQSVLGILESLLKLISVFILAFINYDSLITFSLLSLAITGLIFVIYSVYCTANYKEVNYDIKNLNWGIIKEMLQFIGWSFIGALAILSRNQATSVLINIFFGVVKNATYGIAMQFNAAFGLLSHGIIGALRPKILKSAGSGDINSVMNNSNLMSKFSFIATSFIVIPVAFESEIIIKLWLKTIPEDAVIFTQLTSLFALITCLSAGIQNTFEAIGKVKVYNIVVSVILILNIPFALLFYKFGFPSYTILIVGIMLELISFIVRTFLMKKYIPFSIITNFKVMTMELFIPALIISLFIQLTHSFVFSDIGRLFFTITLIMIIYPLIVYKISLNAGQKTFVENLISKFRLK